VCFETFGAVGRLYAPYMSLPPVEYADGKREPSGASFEMLGPGFWRGCWLRCPIPPPLVVWSGLGCVRSWCLKKELRRVSRSRPFPAPFAKSSHARGGYACSRKALGGGKP
jgi:hypothetical protein